MCNNDVLQKYSSLQERVAFILSCEFELLKSIMIYSDYYKQEKIPSDLNTECIGDIIIKRSFLGEDITISAF